MNTQQSAPFRTFASFYPYYLSEHAHPHCRMLHFIGSWLVLAVIAIALWSAHWSLLWALPLIGYGFAWLGHFVFEKNRPATFRYPFYSLMGDWVMFWDICRGRLDLTTHLSTAQPRDPN